MRCQLCESPRAVILDRTDEEVDSWVRGHQSVRAEIVKLLGIEFRLVRVQLCECPDCDLVYPLVRLPLEPVSRRSVRLTSKARN